MQRIRSLALPAAISLLIAGACQDAPLGPRAPARNEAASAPRQLRLTVFSGHAADSVMELFEHTWTRFDRSAAERSRLDWRSSNNVPAHVRDGLIPSNAIPPNAILTDGGATVPQILSHYEKFYFGTHNQYNTVPSGVEGEMTFVGDQGEIDLGNLTVTPNTGTTFNASGPIARGAGDIVNCADATLAGCNQHHLNGVTLLNAPDCDAHASGSVAYWSAVAKTTFGFSWASTAPGTGGTGVTSVSVSAPVSATAAQCSTGTNTGGPSPTDSTTTPGTGTVGPPPPPTGPNVPVAPPPPTPPPSTPPVGFVCQETSLYEVYLGSRKLISTIIDCYPET